MRVFVLVTAAGSGKRMGRGVCDKPFLPVLGKPMIIRALSVFEKIAGIDAVTLVVRKKNLGKTRTLLLRHGIKKVKDVVAGGDTRTESVRNGIRALKAKDNDIVVVHDGARPLLSADMVKRTVAAAKRYGSAVAGIPCAATIKKVDSRHVVECTPEREALWEAQTPQAFRYKIVKRAYLSGNKAEATDDACLAERLGYKVKMVAGDRMNIKITVPADLRIAEAMLRSRGVSGQ